MERKRLVHQLDTPYSTVQWPHINQEDQDTILELLCNLLSPLGVYRRTHTPPSRGKRSKAKKKEQAKKGESQIPDPVRPPPPPPELSKFIDVGLASITRGLQQGQTADVPAPYAAVFVARSGQASAFHCHFPQIVAVAPSSSSSSSSSSSPVRLVGFSRACEDRLSECLGIPRVSSVALRADAPSSRALLDFVRSKVGPIEVPWLEEAASAGYRETRINAIEVPVGRKKQRVAAN